MYTFGCIVYIPSEGIKSVRSFKGAVVGLNSGTGSRRYPRSFLLCGIPNNIKPSDAWVSVRPFIAGRYLMDNLNLFHELEALLKTDSRYCMDDGTLIKNRIVSDALSLNPELLKYLLSHESLKKNFFSEIDEMLVFDKVKFQQFVMNKSFLEKRNYLCCLVTYGQI